jgi:hypothetical protein
MHEILLYGAPAAGGAAYGVRMWWLRHSMPRRVLDFGPLPGTDGRMHRLADLSPACVVAVVFMSNQCPGVKAYDARLRRLHAQWADRVAFVGINPVSEELYPSESLEQMARAARLRSIPFPYLKDVGQRTARSFGAVCTPEVFVLDRRRRLRYRGRIDDAIVESEASRHFLADALGKVAGQRRVTRRLPASTPPLGCTIEFT